MNEQWIEDIFASYRREEYVPPRFISTNRSFNREGISLYYYIDGYDSKGFVAGLKMDSFDKVRFTNYKKTHPQERYEPYFDKFLSGYSCSYDEMNDLLELAEQKIPTEIVKMAIHWKIKTQKFMTTLAIIYDLLLEAEENQWIGTSDWDGGEFLNRLPSPKQRI